MELDQIFASIQEDYNWRATEMRFFKNILNDIHEESDQLLFRKSMVVMLYAHFEGFCKTSFSTYASAINKEKLKCGDVNDYITVSCLSELFAALFNPNKKSDLFRKILPDDTDVHRVARQVEFIGGVDKLWEREVDIPVEIVVDTESNLTPSILRKILYKLGFPYDAFKEQEGNINRLLGIRNSVAHGDLVSGVSERTYEDLERVCEEVFQGVQDLIWDALKKEQFRKHPKTA